MNFYSKYLVLCNSISKSPSRVALDCGISKTSVNRWKNGSVPTDANLLILADYFNVPVERLAPDDERLVPPAITEEFVTYPILGEVAAGYEHIAYEDWTGDTIDVPQSYLKGRKYDDYFVLRVVGDSMYPLYVDGDVVLVLRQPTMDRSGQIGVVVYEDDNATLKRVDYVMGEDWVKLTPVNPQYPPVMIEGERLEHCRVLGIPKLLIREIRE